MLSLSCTTSQCLCPDFCPRSHCLTQDGERHPGSSVFLSRVPVRLGSLIGDTAPEWPSLETTVSEHFHSPVFFIPGPWLMEVFTKLLWSLKIAGSWPSLLNKQGSSLCSLPGKDQSCLLPAFLFTSFGMLTHAPSLASEPLDACSFLNHLRAELKCHLLQEAFPKSPSPKLNKVKRG